METTEAPSAIRVDGPGPTEAEALPAPTITGVVKDAVRHSRIEVRNGEHVVWSATYLPSDIDEANDAHRNAQTQRSLAWSKADGLGVKVSLSIHVISWSVLTVRTPDKERVTSEANDGSGRPSVFGAIGAR